jgi:hypothetical protein
VAADVELLEFSRFEPVAVIERMDELARSLGGWINLQPNLELEDVPSSGLGVLSIFSARGPAIPLLTWTPGERSRRGSTPAEIGIQHPAGSRAVPILRERGINVPAGWAVVQDHPKRGLVVRPGAGAELATIVEWMLRATAVLCPYELPTSWLATVHRR